MKNLEGMLILILLGSSLGAQAQAAAKKSRGDAVLNFDADVIEGQRKDPEIFTQNALRNVKIDTIVLDRKNFNDFHAVDRNRRPRFLPRTPER